MEYESFLDFLFEKYFVRLTREWIEGEGEVPGKKLFDLKFRTDWFIIWPPLASLKFVKIFKFRNSYCKFFLFFESPSASKLKYDTSIGLIFYVE